MYLINNIPLLASPHAFPFSLNMGNYHFCCLKVRKVYECNGRKWAGPLAPNSAHRLIVDKAQ